MCGILAVLSAPDAVPSDVQSRLDRALRVIRHRGPDGSGTHLDPGGRFALGHVRLAVIDLETTSNQPFWSECGRYGLVFNGEIYNYLELKAELEQAGAAFRTRSDTEVLLLALMHWGPEAVNRLNGMWAFVFIDTLTGEFITSRDRWGVKPLFTCLHRGNLVICSEAKGILAYTGETPEPAAESVGLYLKYGVGGEHSQSWFRGIRRFPPNCWRRDVLGADPRGAGPERRYWQYPLARERLALDEAVATLGHLLTDAVKLRLRSDVPVGLSLSGGLDSGTLAWMVGRGLGQRLDTYTAWHEPRARSELPLAQLVASSFGHRSTPVAAPDTAGALDDLRHCIYHLDAGHASPAIVPYLNLCREARRSLTVMIEGQGADELLGGYQSLALFACADALWRGSAAGVFAAGRQYVAAEGWNGLAANIARFSLQRLYRRQALRWGAPRILPAAVLAAEPDEMLRLGFGGGNLDRALLLSHVRGLANLLQYGDAVSMAVGLESRCPFLDYRLVEFGFRLDARWLIRDGYGKYVLRRLGEPALPAEICWRRGKDAFTSSTVGAVRDLVERSGLPPAGLAIARDAGLFKPAVAAPAFLRGLPDNILYRIVSVLLWCELFYGPDRSVAPVGEPSR